MAVSNKTKRRQKLKKASKSEKNGDSRQDLLELVGQVKAKRNHTNAASSVTVANGAKQDAILGSGAEAEHFKSVFAKFQPAQNTEDDKSASSTNAASVQARRVFETDGPDLDQSNSVEATWPSEKSPQLSKRKQRRLAKVSLAELKSKVLFPELIQWYDCDAVDPMLLAQIKSSKNVVQVPNHWQLKREFLSGRSLTAKKPFELPSIIRQTSIEEMRNTLPTQGATDEQSLKENARARIRPKLGSLDLDYRKLHDAFFKIGRHWKPDFMLPYGDLFYENRNLLEESRWKQMEKDLRPGKLSKELRIAMGLPEGKLPPWCAKFGELGMPPSYPDYNVASVNWDITNLHGDTYGVLGAEQKTKSEPPLFGQMVQLDESDEQTQESEVAPAQLPDVDEKDGRNNSLPERSQERDKKIEDEVRAKAMKEVLKRRNQEKASRGGQEKRRKLYSVIQQKDNSSESELAGKSIAYDLENSKQGLISSRAGVQNQKAGQLPNEQDATDQEEQQNFKF
ncbi:LAFA_0G17150g1_1 [Lachancea sp. 'fantastica']|nr:LAFA_0G17150g1_1 [Lachancea sp. 'fantastica']